MKRKEETAVDADDRPGSTGVPSIGGTLVSVQMKKDLPEKEPDRAPDSREDSPDNLLATYWG